MLFGAVNKDNKSRRFIAKTFEEAEQIAEERGWSQVGAVVAEYDSDGNLIREYNNE